MTGIGAVWLAGLEAGVRMLSRDPSLAVRRLILPASYWRAAEFAYVLRSIAIPPHARVLDLGSPKDLAFFLARRSHADVVATDILEREVRLTTRLAAAQKLQGEQGRGGVVGEVQDGRALRFPDESFDAAYSVSVLEHIPHDGDTVALRELVRVVRPGGRIVVTVPFDTSYRETFVEQAVYERSRQNGDPVFYERHYDHRTLAERLTGAVNARVESIELWGERWVSVEHLLSRLGGVRTWLSPIEPFLAWMILKNCSARPQTRPRAAFFTLRK